MKKRVLSVALVFVFVFAAMGVASFVPKNPPLTASAAPEMLPYQDTSLSFEERAADLVARMTTDEKWPQFGSNNPAISRLGVKAYDYWTEGLHGVARLGPASSFPVSLAMGSTWDPALMLATASATSDEARGYTNGTGRGITYFSPTINLARDPRWGRTDESFSEDPYLTSVMGAQFVDGFQGNDPKYEKINATIKHYAANNSEFNRETGNSVMDSRTFLEYYTRAFKYISLNTRVSSVMGSYNEVNGIPSTANYYMMTQLLRKEWGFGGFVVSDCGAIEDIFQTDRHHFQPDTNYLSTLPGNGAAYVDANGYATEAGGSAMALLAGTDLCCGSAYPTYLKTAWQAGLVTMGEIDNALVRIFTSRFKSGEFDPKDMVPYASDTYSMANQVENAAHKQLAEDAADEAVVLLKNDKAVSTDAAPLLPLDPTKKNIVMLGVYSDGYVLGGYSGDPSAANCSTPKQGVEKILGQPVNYMPLRATASTYLFNMKNIYLKDANGNTVTTLKPALSSLTSGSSMSSDGSNVTNIVSGAVFTYSGLNLSNIASLSVETAGTSTSLQGQIVFHLGSADGPIVATVTSSFSGAGDQWHVFSSAVSGVSDQTSAALVGVTVGNPAPSNSSTSTYVMNVSNVTLNTGSAVTTTLTPPMGTIISGCQLESQTNFGYVGQGAYIGYPNVNLNGITSISIMTSGPSDTIQGDVEFHWNSPSGPLLGKVTSTATGNWNTWAKFTTASIDLSGLGGQTNGTLYAVMKGNPSVQLNVTQAQKDAIAAADAVIVCVGTDVGDSAEGHDRSSLDLPNSQASIIDLATSLNPRTVLYIQAVGMVNVEGFKSEVPAMLWCSYNGQAQGNAMARVIFGQANPSAKLPFTWYTTQYQLPGIGDYSIRSSATSDGRTYQYFDGDITYPFGYGLSYTDFAFSGEKVDKTAITPDDTVNVSVDVKNTGTVKGADVVEVYVVPPTHDGQDRPLKQLKGFDKVTVAAGATQTVTIPMNVSDWYFTDPVTGNETFDQGAYTLQVCTTADDVTAEFTLNLTGSLTPKVQTVCCLPDKVVLDLDNNDTVTANASATLNDDSAASPEVMAKIVYSSSNDTVAKVDAAGSVTPLQMGTALITATLTYGGVTKSDSFPVEVVQGANLPVVIVQYEDSSLTDNGVTVSGLLPVDGSMSTQLIADPANPYCYSTMEKINATLTAKQVGALAVYRMTYIWRSTQVSLNTPVTIQITVPDGFTGDRVFSFDSSTGQVAAISGVTISPDGRTLTFTGTGMLYYAVASLLGDVDFSGAINTVDARLVLQSIVNKTTLTPQQAVNADVNCDTKIDTVDARLILQYIVSKIPAFPIEG